MQRCLRYNQSHKHPSLGRRLNVQRLEQRIALSTTGGGFLDVDSKIDSLDFDDSQITISIPGGHVLTSDFILHQSYNPRNEEDFSSDLSDSHVDLIFDDGMGLNIDVLPIQPPPLNPIGEPIPIDDPPISESPPAQQEMKPEQVSKNEREQTKGGEQQTKLTHAVVLSRGREISFNMATVAPPRSLPESNSSATNIDAANEKAIASISRLPQRSSPIRTHRVSNTTSEAIAEPKLHSTHTEHSTVLPTNAQNPTDSTSLVRPTQSNQQESQSTSSEQSHPTSAEKAANWNPQESKPIDSSEEATLSQVFADWRKHDLIALPILLALVAGRRIARNFLAEEAESHQLPPRKKC